MHLKKAFAAAATLSLLATLSPAFAQTGDGVQAQTVVTIMSKTKTEAPVPVQQNDFKVQVNGKTASITDLVPLRGERGGLELVILIDAAARTSLGRQMSDIQQFVKSLPPTTEVGIAYMQNGRAVFEQPLTADKDAALRSLHLPGGAIGVSASPYFCLSDLAKQWPSKNAGNRREVVMVTDGVDPYNLRFDPDDPYLQSAINDSIRAGLIVHSIYWRNEGRIDRSLYQTNAGQSLLSIVCQATGGTSYWQGTGNPISFSPYFDDLSRRLQNQYELGFTTPAKAKPDVATLKVKLAMPNARLDSAQRVLVVPGGIARDNN